MPWSILTPSERALATHLGIPFCTPGQAPSDQDCVIHASGQPDGLKLAMSLLGNEGRLIEMSWFGEDDVTLPFGGAFHSQRLTLRASQVGQLPTKLLPVGIIAAV